MFKTAARPPAACGSAPRFRRCPAESPRSLFLSGSSFRRVGLRRHIDDVNRRPVCSMSALGQWLIFRGPRYVRAISETPVGIETSGIGVISHSLADHARYAQKSAEAEAAAAHRRTV